MWGARKKPKINRHASDGGIELTRFQQRQRKKQEARRKWAQSPPPWRALAIGIGVLFIGFPTLFVSSLVFGERESDHAKLRAGIQVSRMAARTAQDAAGPAAGLDGGTRTGKMPSGTFVRCAGGACVCERRASLRL